MKFDKLRALVEKEFEFRIDDNTAWIEGRKENSNDNWVSYYLTKKAQKDYIDGNIDKREAQCRAIMAMKKVEEKRRTAQLEKIASAENAEKPKLISIGVEWKKSKTWGHNPHASIRVLDGGIFEGSASGCGYDKQSAAVAEALNKSPAIMSLLYAVAETNAKTIDVKKPHDAYEKIFGYGIGYGILPRFEGGVGIECYPKIFKVCGYTWENGTWSNTLNTYFIGID